MTQVASLTADQKEIATLSLVIARNFAIMPSELHMTYDGTAVVAAAMQASATIVAAYLISRGSAGLTAEDGPAA